MNFMVVPLKLRDICRKQNVRIYHALGDNSIDDLLGVFD